MKKVKSEKEYHGAEPKCKKVHAILNSIVDFADFSRKSDGERCWHWREFLRFLVPKCYADDCVERNENLEM